MDDTYWSNVAQEIAKALEALFPYGDGQAPFSRVCTVLERVAQHAYKTGQDSALMALLTLDDALEQVNAWLQEQGQKPINRKRLAVIARNRHQRFGIGWPVPGTGQWLFRPEEIAQLRPAINYRPNAKA